jgi:hypothetical protein
MTGEVAMRQMEMYKKNISLSETDVNTVIYFITIDDLKDAATGIELETYGVGITINESGETEVISNVTFSKSGILSLVALLASHLVTPVSLSDVVNDWLCAC